MNMLPDNPPSYEKLENGPSTPTSGSAYPLHHNNAGGDYPPQPKDFGQQHTHTIVMQQPAPVIQQPPQSVIVVNNGRVGGKGRCSACNYGQLKDHYSCCAICLCIFLFPVGCLCCLCMRNKKCNHCGIEF